jgi:transcriptional regulator with XRE-family HTH domain
MVKIGDTEYTTAEDLFEASGLTATELAVIDLKVELLGKLIEAREKRGLSQKALADLCGTKQPYIARIEKGETDPQLTSLIKILTPLGYTLAIVPQKKPACLGRSFKGRNIRYKSRKVNLKPDGPK